jgi:orotate phosphoribosyltransferase
MDGTSHEPFPLTDFADWLRGIISATQPDLVVGIARGAIRLLQLASADRHVSVPQVVTQHALPFFGPDTLSGKRVLIFDDSVIFGSTLASAYEDLRRRGALPFCASYVVGRAAQKVGHSPLGK